ncbi:serine/threonine-protein kinase WNK4 [Carex littledalei]|uniref:non-specific serine/threonine protein kinase n=1 Tax=Carex littledalei TaxID=544730 RepID=A0A833QZR9_9POAL|nr:serine/threonine-protein kinase WNK4 [Carex littledalei]
MGKNGGSKAGSDTDPEGVVEIDPTQRYLRYSDVLGKGAYKKVYKAFDQIDGIEVAWNKVSIEQMLQSPENLSWLYSEVHFLKTLRHQNILRFHTSWVDDENRHINIITELFISGSLRSYRKMHQRVDLKAIKNWARQILRGLVFLHSHKPPIIHRDLKCDNIFINGNSGEVKIGDLGLATMMLQAKARSVLGTPEFMAPELYDEEYNELVDIYSFGMCMLEMVTLEYPYSECHNAAQIFKRVSSGVKPAALEKVTNLQLRYFIEQCLFPASERKSAKELLEDPFLQCSTSQEINPFLQCSTSREINHNNTVTSVQPPQSHRSTSAEKKLLDIDAVSNRSNPTSDVGVEANYIEPVAISNGGVESNPAEAGPPVLEFVRVNRDIEFRLEGGTIDENSVSLFMRITDSNDHVRNVHFTFYLDSDTSLGVAGEMVEQLELGDYHVPFYLNS